MGTIEIIGTVLAALGGVEFVKWWHTRKASKKMADFDVLQRTTVFLQEQLDLKEKRFAEQTELVRKLQRDLLEETKNKGQLEVEMAQVRCNDKTCPFREPPNAWTPPRVGLTKEEHFSKKLGEEIAENGTLN